MSPEPWRPHGTRLPFLVAAILGLLLAPGVATAQSIGGTVTNATGAVLPGVTVEARSPALIEQARSVVTEGNGAYSTRWTIGLSVPTTSTPSPSRSSSRPTRDW